MSTTTLTRPPSIYAPHTKRISLRQSQQDGNLTKSRTATRRRRRNGEAARKDPPPLIHKVGLAAQIYGIQGFMGTVSWIQGWTEWFYPPNQGPNIVKAYEVRPRMPVRIFFPASYDLTSPQTLPTILTIHGGGFCIGTAKDDDEWNRKLSDSQNMLVISLPYQKAPRVPFPGGLYDLEALYLAVLGDESLPMDRTSQNNTRTGSKTRGVGRVAILGFDAGGNLALSLSQLPKIRHSPVPPTAVVSISGHLDLERSMNEKIQNRSYKPSLSFPRNATFDPLAATYSAYTWSYVPYGHDLRDPLLSPAFARWGSEDTDTITGGLPPHVCLVGAELDMLAHESWRMACRLVRDGGVGRGDGRTGRWRVPDADADDDALQQICGRRAPANTKGQLEFSDESQGQEEDGMDASKRFGFEVKWKGEKEEGVGEGSVKWILVPDVLHGFDRQWFSAGAEETLRDAELKTVAYVNAIGGWLRGTVWGM